MFQPAQSQAILTGVTITNPQENDVLAFDGMGGWNNVPSTSLPVGGATVVTDNDTIEGDGSDLDKIRLKRVYTDGTTVLGEGTQADPLTSPFTTEWPLIIAANSPDWIQEIASIPAATSPSAIAADSLLPSYPADVSGVATGTGIFSPSTSGRYMCAASMSGVPNGVVTGVLRINMVQTSPGAIFPIVWDEYSSSGSLVRASCCIGANLTAGNHTVQAFFQNDGAEVTDVTAHVTFTYVG